MSEILCRIDPEDMVNYISGDMVRHWKDSVRDYLTAHAVPEAPVLFGGVGEVAEFMDQQGLVPIDYTAKYCAQAILGRFGIPWVDGAHYFVGEQYTESGSRFDRGVVTIHRPALSLEERREKARKMLENADDELLKRLGV